MSSESAEDGGLPLMAFAMDTVRSGEGGPEPFILHPKGPELMTAATEALLLSPETGKDKKDKFRSVLALCYTLEHEYKSPTAARTLLHAITDNPGVAQLLGIETKALREHGAKLKKFLGDEAVKRAPKLEEAAPMGSLKLSSFLDPGRDPQAAARAGGKKPKPSASKGPARRRGQLGGPPPGDKKG